MASEATSVPSPAERERSRISGPECVPRPSTKRSSSSTWTECNPASVREVRSGCDILMSDREGPPLRGCLIDELQARAVAMIVPFWPHSCLAGWRQNLDFSCGDLLAICQPSGTRPISWQGSSSYADSKSMWPSEFSRFWEGFAASQLWPFICSSGTFA